MKHDKDVVDLVLVIGTSLKVAPVSEVVGFLPPNVPQLYISRTVRGILDNIQARLLTTYPAVFTCQLRCGLAWRL